MSRSALTNYFRLLFFFLVTFGLWHDLHLDIYFKECVLFSTYCVCAPGKPFWDHLSSHYCSPHVWLSLSIAVVWVEVYVWFPWWLRAELFFFSTFPVVISLVALLNCTNRVQKKKKNVLCSILVYGTKGNILYLSTCFLFYHVWLVVVTFSLGLYGLNREVVLEKHAVCKRGFQCAFLW